MCHALFSLVIIYTLVRLHAARARYTQHTHPYMHDECIIEKLGSMRMLLGCGGGLRIFPRLDYECE